MSEYLIQGETLTAIAEKIRSYTSVVGNSTHIISDEFIENIYFLIPGTVLVYYYENVDSYNFFLNNCDYPDEYDGGLRYWAYLFNAEGNMVPAIFMAYDDVMVEPYFYVGVETINGEICDKWRKIELTDGDGGQPTDEDNYTWNAEAKKYIYTNRIVICSNEVDESISPTDMPSKIDEVYDAGAANGGITLPTLDNEGTAEDLVYGKQLIDSEGNIVEGTAATYDEAYGDGYGDGYYDASKITDLTGKSLRITAGWSAEAGYGEFEIDGIYTRVNSNGSLDLYPSNIQEIGIGYSSNGTQKINSLTYATKYGTFSISSSQGFCIGITGGADATNTKLIDWLNTHGILRTYSEIREEGYTLGQSEIFEELDTLVDWQVTLLSTGDPLLSVVNYHPNKVLFCEFGIILPNGSRQVETVIVFPNSSTTATLDELAWGEGATISLKNVRWSNDY